MTTAPPMDATTLAEAFQVFARASEDLTQAYNGLQGQVSTLTERLNLLLAALPAGVVVLDCHGRVEQLNRAAQEMFGSVASGAAWAQTIARCEASETPGEYLLQRGADTLRVTIAETALDTSGGRIVLVHDITEPWLMRMQKARNERLAAMGEMVASLAHQLRTPLAAAVLYLGHLASAVPMALPERGKVAGRALDRLRHLERLIQDMLIFARGEALGREKFSVCDLVAELAQTIEPVAQRRGVAFRTACAAGDASLFGNRKEIAGALTNLLDNAMQAVSGEGGAVTLEARAGDDGAAFHIRDNGRGIDQALQDRLFEPFFTTRAEGTGLGLAIARGVARAHGGEIRVLSKPGEGSVFTLSLPVARVGAPAGEVLAPALAGAGVRS